MAAISQASPASSGASYRDRTSEFRAAVERLKRSLAGSSSSSSSSAAAAVDGGVSSALDKSSFISDFNRKASKAGSGIHEASKKVARLSKLTKRSSMFDDPAREIQDLIALLRQDMTGLNALIIELESILGNTNSSKDSIEHSKTVVSNLKGRLLQITNEFKEVLTIRTENLKIHENRKQLFTASTSGERGNPFAQTSPVRHSHTDVISSNSVPPWVNNSKPAQTAHPSDDAVHGTSRSTHLRRRTGAGSLPLMPSQMQMQEEVQDHAHGRSSALQSVETTITELSGMFTQLATMVSQHGELAIRIDDNMDETLTNVEGAQGALVKYLHHISSNRWLIIKIFIVLLIFMIVFIVFIS